MSKRNDNCVEKMSLKVPTHRPLTVQQLQPFLAKQKLVSSHLQLQQVCLLVLVDMQHPAHFHLRLLADRLTDVHVVKVTTQEKSSTVKVAKQLSFVKRATEYITTGHHAKVVRLLLRDSDSVRRQFLQTLTILVRKEMVQRTKNSKHTSQTLTKESLGNFSWRPFLKETRYHLPIIHTVIDAAVSTEAKSDKVKVLPADLRIESLGGSLHDLDVNS